MSSINIDNRYTLRNDENCKFYRHWLPLPLLYTCGEIFMLLVEFDPRLFNEISRSLTVNHPDGFNKFTNFISSALILLSAPGNQIDV